MAEQRFFIASLKHTGRDHEHIVWWGLNHCGYTPVVGDYIGFYSEEEARELNDGHSTVAVPVDRVAPLLSPEPYYLRRGSLCVRFYDQRGQVVDNTRANWQQIIDNALSGLVLERKPVIFRRKRRSMSMSDALAAARHPTDTQGEGNG